MLSHVLVAGYLGVGFLCSSFYIHMRNKNIKDLENGKQIEDYEEEQLKKIARSNKLVGGIGTIAIIFISITIFWLPSILLDMTNDLFKKIR